MEWHCLVLQDALIKGTLVSKYKIFLLAFAIILASFQCRKLDDIWTNRTSGLLLFALSEEIFFFPFPLLPKLAIFKYWDIVKCHLKPVPAGPCLGSDGGWEVVMSLAGWYSTLWDIFTFIVRKYLLLLVLAGGTSQGNCDSSPLTYISSSQSVWFLGWEHQQILETS